MTKHHLEGSDLVLGDMPGPERCYRHDLQKPDFQFDASQAQAVKLLQRVFDALQKTGGSGKHVTRTPAPKAKTLFGMIKKKTPDAVVSNLEPAVKGLYLWGGVGRGKTYLMDTFYACLPGQRKLRIHFHRFMRRVHGELRALQGQANPLNMIGRQLAKDVDILCFDEFFVTDITDAMILAGVLQAIFDEGVVLVTTSNIPPQELYKDGLQRERFLPAIHLLQQNLTVYNLDSGVDYRLRVLERAEIYHHPLDEAATLSLQASFDRLAPSEAVVGQSIEIESRQIDTLRYAEGVLWCDFAALCDGPRSQNDYIELARIFAAVLVSNVPQFDGRQDDQARRFINMVDEFYDRNVKLIVSAAAPIANLYTAGRLEFEFKRTQSRLLEMQSHAYLERPHLP